MAEQVVRRYEIHLRHGESSLSEVHYNIIVAASHYDHPFVKQGLREGRGSFKHVKAICTGTDRLHSSTW